MNYFHRYTHSELVIFSKHRENEIRLGQHVGVGFTGSKYVIVGIPEDIGVKANFGIGGTNTIWEAFLKELLNIQSTEKFEGNEISVLGFFDFSPLIKNTTSSVENLRASVEVIDREVEQVVEEIVLAGKIPIIIGGGHNNSYPIIKGVAKGLAKTNKIKLASINCVNLDAHSDFREMEGRHSGNGFRYAYHEGYLKKYAMIGLHENYNAQKIINELRSNPDFEFTFWEDIFLRENISYKSVIENAISFTRNNFTGVELDLDSVEHVVSSAATPSGLTTLQARQFVYEMAIKSKVAYLHICEGAITLETGSENNQTGKLVCYLVSDFIKNAG